MRCKHEGCGWIATRSSIYGVFCEEHWRKEGMDGTSVEEEVEKKNYHIGRNHD